jgi:hypothetical protein
MSQSPLSKPDSKKMDSHENSSRSADLLVAAGCVC